MKKVITLILLVLLPLSVAAYTLGRVSVHDPSIVWEPTSQTYYIFGSFRKVAKTNDMMNWTEVASGTDPEGAVGVPWKVGDNNNAPSADAFSTPAVTKVTVRGEEKDLPAFDAKAWSAKGTSETYDITGNLWAPDVIWNPVMQKWCMYMSVNGNSWYSSIVLLTADHIEGPYTYQAPIVISGFTASNYTETDLPLVIGEEAAFPTRYASPWVSTGKAGNPNNIDPCVFYDETGKLWMSYGSWSGGIFMLELDENTGLRDYDVIYETSDTSDPYFGKKIAGGYYSSGEASYIEYINGYYYLFVSYGGLAAGGVANDYNNGGYQMRVFRSKNPDGPYVDSKNASAVYSSYQLNFGANANDNNRGENIFGCYGNWGNQTVGTYSERSQGHNSIIAAQDGRTYLVYHTRFQNRYEFHEVRVHQVFQNEDGWLVAAPFEYTGEEVTSADIASTQQIATANIPSHYKLLVHHYGLDHTAKEIVTPVEIELKGDGTVTGAYTGTWTVTEGTSYVQITLGETTYKGVMVEQTMEPTNEKVVAFTAMSSSNGINIWGHQFTPDEPVSGDYTTGILAYYHFNDLPIANYYDAEQKATLQKEGSNAVPAIQSDSERDGKVIHTWFGASGNTSNVKFANPLYGKTLTDGATISFWVNPIDENLWDVLFAFYKSDGGRLYMTGNNYIGYNIGAWIDLNHPNSVTTNDLTFSAWNFVTVTFSRTDGVKVYVDGVHKPFQSNSNGDATLDYNALMVDFIQDCPDFYFGYGSWWGSANAMFDELLIYDRPLTADDAKALYQKEMADNKFLEVVPEEPAEVPTPVYFNDFSSTDGVTVIGSGEFITDADPHFGQVYHNDPNLTKAVRTNYLKLPEDVLMHAATTKEMTITFWVNKMNAADYYWSPVFTAYGAVNGPKASHADDWYPFFYAETRGVLGWNSNGYCDFTAEQNDAGTNTESTVWTDDGQWHLYTMTFTPSSAKVYIDGEVLNSWTIANNGLEGLFTQTNLVYVCLGGNQAWGWNDPDPAFAFDDFAVYDAALTAGQIAQIIADKNAPPLEPIVLALKDKADNAEAISANLGATVDVKLEGRTLVRTGEWNTLTLPFSVADISGTPLEGATIKELDATASDLDAEGVMTLVFKTATAIEAGKPYIVKWTDANLSNITDPLFTGVQITTTEPEAVTFSNAKGTGDCEFVGQFSPFAITNETINEIIFLSSGSRLGYSQNARSLNSFRAHFMVPSVNGEPGMSRGIIDFGDGTTAIISPRGSSMPSDDRWYSIDGRKLPSKPTSKGVYINQNRKKLKIKDER